MMRTLVLFTILGLALASKPSLTRITGGWSGCTKSNRCGMCQGDCDNDQDCGHGLRCFERNGFTTIHACTKGGKGDVNSMDYCVPQPAGKLHLMSGASNLWSGCTSAKKCGHCQGECDRDSDCMTGLKCFQRNGHTQVPGCSKGGSQDKKDYDYCIVDPKSAVQCPTCKLNSKNHVIVTHLGKLTSHKGINHSCKTNGKSCSCKC